jgi:tRNA nucleotidyltransferase (CCA-adding enzyme)
MPYAELLRAALAEPDWSILQRLAEIAVRLEMSLYIVGGPVRDCLLRRTVTDLDLTTEGDALTLARTAAHELGGAWKKFERFGTAKLFFPGRSSPIDLATTRTETYTHPGALPDVTRGTIHTDLVRRDFTFNALAIRLDGDHQGELIDRHDGEQDLRQGLVRVLHARSFEDDPTRLFRGARFEQRFSFAFAPDTLQLIPPALPVLDQVSGDRIRHELELIFCEVQPLKSLLRLHELGILSQIDPAFVIDEWIAARFQTQAAPFDRFTSWAWLTCRLPESSLTRFSQRVNLARADAVDAAQVKAVRDAQETIGREQRRSEIYRALAAYSDRALRTALTVIDQPEAQQNIVLCLNELRDVKPALDGHQLQALGASRGPALGHLLEQIHSAVLDGVISTPQQEEDYARQLIAREGQGS